MLTCIVCLFSNRGSDVPIFGVRTFSGVRIKVIMMFVIHLLNIVRRDNVLRKLQKIHRFGIEM